MPDGPIQVIDDLPQVDPPQGSPAPVAGASSGANTNLAYADNSVNTANVTNNVNQFPEFTSKLYETPGSATDTGGAQYIDLTTAGSFVIKTAGTFFLCNYGVSTLNDITAQDATVCAWISFDDRPPFPFSVGFELSGRPFSKVTISWPAQAGKGMYVLILQDFPVDRVDAAS